MRDQTGRRVIGPRLAPPHQERLAARADPPLLVTGDVARLRRLALRRLRRQRTPLRVQRPRRASYLPAPVALIVAELGVGAMLQPRRHRLAVGTGYVDRYGGAPVRLAGQGAGSPAVDPVLEARQILELGAVAFADERPAALGADAGFRGGHRADTAAMRLPIQFITGTAMLFPSALYRGPSAAGLPLCGTSV